MTDVTAARGLERRTPETRAWTGQERARRFRKAARHSRLIRILRIAIPLGIVAACGGIVSLTLFNPIHQPIEAADEVDKPLVTGSKVVMELPRLDGFTSDQLPYNVTAKAALQDLSNPGTVEFKEVRAQVKNENEGDITITAATGVYNSKADILRLQDDVLVRTGSGMEARLSEAVVDVKKGMVTSDLPVTVIVPNGTVDANRLELWQAGSVVLFSRGVVTNLNAGSTPQVGGKARAP